MALDLTSLTAEVTRLETVKDSTLVLLHKLLEEISALKDDPAEIEALVNRIKVSADALALAVEENTEQPEVVVPVEEVPVVKEPVVEEPVVEPVIE